jgi:hypothetical protein
VFYGNPDCQTQCEDLPCSAQYPGHLGQKRGIVPRVVSTEVDTEDDILSCYFLISLVRATNPEYIIKTYPLKYPYLLL